METDSGMDRLASCYFCGVAVEAPLEEYPVVPRDLRPSVDDQSTVVLCPECRRKLSTIVERVVRVATAPDRTESGTQRTLGESDVPNDGDRSRERSSVLEGFDHGSPDLFEMSKSEQSDPEEEARPGPHSSSKEHSEEREKASRNERGDIDEGWFGGEGDESDQGDHVERDQDKETSTEETPAEETAGSEGVEQRAFSQAAYNHVVKLLQNREFPVETDAILTVADSAYEIDTEETQAILSALIDRGVIERDGNQLRRPDP